MNRNFYVLVQIVWVVTACFWMSGFRSLDDHIVFIVRVKQSTKSSRKRKQGVLHSPNNSVTTQKT
jgi:hypothetical protein